MNLLNIDGGTKELYVPVLIASPTKSLSTSPHSSPTDKINLCIKVFRILRRSTVLKILLPVASIILTFMLISAFKHTTKDLLQWIETQNLWATCFIFLLLFTLVSFPVAVGYLVLIISCGYMFSLWRGLLVAIIGANLGVAIAHYSLRSLHRYLPIHRLIKTETGRAILRVISGPRAFRVILLARLTPIPFGLQNTIFGISAVNSFDYHTATLLGLLPAQVINVYLGSKLRSIHDVINDNHTAVAGYGMFLFEAIVGVSLMMWVIRKAKSELAAALLDSIDVDEKLLIEVDV